MTLAIVGGLIFGVFSLLPILLAIGLVWWLVRTLDSINRNVGDIARYLGRREAERSAEVNRRR